MITKSLSRPVFTAACLAALFYSAAVFAMPPAPKLPIGKIKLTKAQVEKCVKLVPAFFDTFKSEKRKLQRAKKTKTPPPVGVDALLKNKSKLAKLKKFASANGYADVNEFIKSFSGVMISYAYLKLQRTEKYIAGKLNQIPPQMRGMVKQKLNTLKKLKNEYKDKVDPATIDAVAPFVSTIDKALATKPGHGK